MPKGKYFSTKIRELKAEYKANGLTYKNLARDLDISPGTLRRWEKSKRYYPPQSFDKSDVKFFNRIYLREVAPVIGNLVKPDFSFELKTKSLQGKQEKLLFALDKKGIEYNDFFAQYWQGIDKVIKKYGSKPIITTQSITQTKKAFKIRLKLQTITLKKSTSKINTFTIPYDFKSSW